MNIRTVRKKINSIKNVRKITKAMQMVSAVKMRKAQQLEAESKPYREGITELISKLMKKVDSKHSKLLQVDTSQASKQLVVIVSSNKGLAGSFNVNVFRHVLKEIPDFKKVDFVTIGNKASQFFGRLKDANILAEFSSGNMVIEASAIFDFILKNFKTGNYKSVSIIYNGFISTMRSEVREDILLPFNLVKIATESSKESKENKESELSESADLIIEPSPQAILEDLLESFIESKVRGALISSEAVEHSARMMAMKSATDNATELVYKMTLLANRLRQEKITYELLDMITAKESVDM